MQHRYVPPAMHARPAVDGHSRQDSRPPACATGHRAQGATLNRPCFRCGRFHHSGAACPTRYNESGPAAPVSTTPNPRAQLTLQSSPRPRFASNADLHFPTSMLAVTAREHPKLAAATPVPFTQRQGDQAPTSMARAYAMRFCLPFRNCTCIHTHMHAQLLTTQAGAARQALLSLISSLSFRNCTPMHLRAPVCITHTGADRNPALCSA
jgi:hypothetical protein